MCNVDYKLISSVIKNRIIGQLCFLVGNHQTCNVPNRSIMDNLCFFRELLSTPFDGAILSLDQEAAFDRVNRGFMFTVLKKYNFPDLILKSLKLLHENSRIMVKVGNSLTDYIPVARGVKQGDPVSSLLFVLCFEPFLARIRKLLSEASGGANKNFVPVAAYADDCQLILTDSSEFDIVEFELKKYFEFSGGKLNRNKSNCLLLGKWQKHPPRISFPAVTNGCEILGISFGSSAYVAQNWDSL